MGAALLGEDHRLCLLDRLQHADADHRRDQTGISCSGDPVRFEFSVPRGRHAGLVREVADLKVACRFYEDVVGLTRERTSRDFVGFGWLAIEFADADDRARQLSLPALEELEASRQAIRVYVDDDDLTDRHRDLSSAGLRVTPLVESRSGARFRCSDPDGYVVEFRKRGGGPR